MPKPSIRSLAAAATLCALSAGAHASFVINLNFSGLNATQQSYFTDAKNDWESVITGYQGGISLTRFTVDATGANIDGAGCTLGFAGPDAAVSQGGFNLTTSGSMFFDLDDTSDLITAGSFTDVIKHEMVQVIGFGTLWKLNNVYVKDPGAVAGHLADVAGRQAPPQGRSRCLSLSEIA